MTKLHKRGAAVPGTQLPQQYLLLQKKIVSCSFLLSMVLLLFANGLSAQSQEQVVVLGSGILIVDNLDILRSTSDPGSGSSGATETWTAFLQVYDQDGQEVHNGYITSGQQVDLSHLRAGLYSLRITPEEGPAEYLQVIIN